MVSASKWLFINFFFKLSILKSQGNEEAFGSTSKKRESAFIPTFKQRCHFLIHVMALETNAFHSVLYIYITYIQYSCYHLVSSRMPCHSIKNYLNEALINLRSLVQLIPPSLSGQTLASR